MGDAKRRGKDKADELEQTVRADVVVSHEPAADGVHEDCYVTIREAFEAARRQLQDAVRKLEER